MNDRVFSVEVFNQYLKAVVDAEELLRDIRIVGEISGFGVRGRHAYFTLKDDAAQIACVFFDFDGPIPRDGERVILIGSPNFYVRGGKLSFNAKNIEPAGVGDAYRRFLELKEKLEREGLFDRKIAMPDRIRRIGVITSPTGAVIHDIATVAFRRDPSVDIVLYPVKVQGIGAAEEIAAAISRLDAYRKVDVIVVARGGGSMEDLAAFNDESVARAAANCKKFILSAVGHETDFSLCDFCSDLRAATPSAAAELLTVDRREKALALVRALNGAMNALTEAYETQERSLRFGTDRLARACNRGISMSELKLSDRLRKIDGAISNAILERGERMGRILQRLELKNPVSILKEGYACVCSDRRIRRVSELREGERVRIDMADGSFDATVERIDKKEA